MSDLFSPPSFIPSVAMVQLKRHLRDFRSLAERGDGFELQGYRVVELRSDASFITARLAKRASRSPEWDTLVLKNAADVRKCVDEVKKRLARWTEE